MVLLGSTAVEPAYIAVELARTIQKRLALVHGAARSEALSARAVVDVAGRIIPKVAAREGAIVPLRLVVAAKPGKIESSIDLPHQMIFGNCVAKMKLVELFRRPDHGSTWSRFAPTQRNHASCPLSTDFCNKIGPKLTCPASTAMSAAGEIVLQNSKVAAVQIVGENLKRKEVDDLQHSFGRVTEVAHEFGARRRGPSDHYTKNAQAAPRISDPSCKTNLATQSGSRRT